MAQGSDLNLTETFPQPLDTAQASRALGCSVEEIKRMVKSGRLVGYRVGRRYRFEPEAIENYKRNHSTLTHG